MMIKVTASMKRTEKLHGSRTLICQLL